MKDETKETLLHIGFLILCIIGLGISVKAKQWKFAVQWGICVVLCFPLLYFQRISQQTHRRRMRLIDKLKQKIGLNDGADSPSEQSEVKPK